MHCVGQLGPEGVRRVLRLQRGAHDFEQAETSSHSWFKKGSVLSGLLKG